MTSSCQRSVSCNVLSKWGPSSDCRARDESSTITDIWPLPPSASVHCPPCTLTTDNVYPELRPLIGHSPGHRGLSLAQDVLLVRSQHYNIPVAGNFTLFLKCEIQKRRKHLWVATGDSELEMSLLTKQMLFLLLKPMNNSFVLSMFPWVWLLIKAWSYKLFGGRSCIYDFSYSSWQQVLRCYVIFMLLFWIQASGEMEGFYSEICQLI